MQFLRWLIDIICIPFLGPRKKERCEECGAMPTVLEDGHWLCNKCAAEHFKARVW